MHNVCGKTNLKMLTKYDEIRNYSFTRLKYASCAVIVGPKTGRWDGL
jgi:hypothetical protein